MIKKLTINLVLILLVLYASGQSITIEKLLPYDSELKHIGNGYAFTEMGKKKKDIRPFTIKYYNYDLVNEFNITFDIPKSCGLRELIYNGDVFLTIFENTKENTYIYYTHDTAGNKIGEKTDQKNKRGESYPEVYASDSKSFIFFRTIKGEKWGYRVEKTASNLETTWEHEYIPDQLYATYTRPVVNEYGIAFLRPQHNSSSGFEIGIGPLRLNSSSNYTPPASYDLIFLDPNTGKETGVYSLLQSGYILEPTTLQINSSGSSILGGMYFNYRSKDMKENSDGTYLLKVSNEGKQEFLTTLPWKDPQNGLQQFLTDENKGATFLSKVIYHQISYANGKFYLIGEVFQKAVSGVAMAANVVSALQNDDDDVSSIAINILDFLVLTFDENGALINKAKVKKPKRTVYQQENISKDLKAVEGIDFDFQFMAQNQMIDQGVIFSGQESQKMVINPFFGYFPLENLNETNEFKKIPFKRKGKLFDGDANLIIYPHQSAKALKYEYYPSKARLFLEVIDFNF